MERENHFQLAVVDRRPGRPCAHTTCGGTDHPCVYFFDSLGYAPVPETLDTLAAILIAKSALVERGYPAVRNELEAVDVVAPNFGLLHDFFTLTEIIRVKADIFFTSSF